MRLGIVSFASPIDEWLLCPESEREPFSEAWFPEIFGQSSSQSTQTEPCLAAVEAAPRRAETRKRSLEPGTTRRRAEIRTVRHLS